MNHSAHQEKKVVIVDDSVLVQAVLREIIDADPRLRVVGTARDPYEAREVIKRTNPDVITLDIEMPRMNGIAFLKNLMRLRPLPVVMISTLTQAGAPATLEALELGAVDFLGKPDAAGGGSLAHYGEQIGDKLFWASKARLLGPAKLPGNSSTRPTGAQAKVAGVQPLEDALCVIGASTGGTEAIRLVLQQMPPGCPPVAIVQHIPEAFSASFARRLDAASSISVCQAQQGQPLEAGHAYVAPGNAHLRIAREQGRLVCRLDDSAPINRHRPAVEALFDSLLHCRPRHASAALLTGMGADGAVAMRRLFDAGIPTAAQDEATSVVWGMPGVAVKLNAASEVLPLDQIAGFLLKSTSVGASRRAL